MPEEAVLWFEDPVGLVGEIEVAAGDVAHLGCVVGGHAFGGDDAEVEFAVDDTDGGVPLVDEEVGRVAVAFLDPGVVPVPVGATEVPVVEPHFLGFEVLLFEVEHAVVCEEGFETSALVVALDVVVVSGEPVDAVAAEGGATGTDAFAVDHGEGCSPVGGGHVVFHAESAVVAGDLLKPFHAEAGDAATVGGDDEVAGAGHDLEVPAGAPELADGALGTAFAEEERGIGLGGVVVVGVDEPGEHVLAVDGLHVALLDFAHAHLREDVVVEGGELGALGEGVGGVVAVEGVGVLDGLLGSDDGGAVEVDADDVVVAVAELADGLGFAIKAKDLAHAAIGDDGEEFLVVVGPADVADAVVELLGEVDPLAGGEVEDHQAQLVAFVAVAFHAFPSHHGAVVGEDGVLVVAHDAFGEVAGFTGGDVVEVDVAVGGVGVVVAGFFAAGVDNLGAVRVVVVLLGATPGAHGALVGAVDDGDGVVEVGGAVLEGNEVDLRNFIHPLVPVAIHKVLVDAAGGLLQTGEELADVLGTLYGDGADVDQRAAVGSQLEALEAALAGGDDALVEGLDVDAADFISTAEEQRVVVFPHGAELALGGVGEALGLAAGDRHEVEFGVVLVLLHVGVAEGVDDVLAVGADGVLAHDTQAPHHLGGETAVLDGDIGFADDVARGLGVLVRLAGGEG